MKRSRFVSRSCSCRTFHASTAFATRAFCASMTRLRGLNLGLHLVPSTAFVALDGGAHVDVLLLVVRPNPREGLGVGGVVMCRRQILVEGRLAQRQQQFEQHRQALHGGEEEKQRQVCRGQGSAAVAYPLECRQTRQEAVTVAHRCRIVLELRVKSGLRGADCFLQLLKAALGVGLRLGGGSVEPAIGPLPSWRERRIQPVALRA